YYVKVSEETLLNQLGMQPLRDSLLKQALEYYEKFLAERQDDAALRAQVAQAEFFVGRITETIDSPEKALPHYTRAAEIEERLLAEPQKTTGTSIDALTADHAQTLNAKGRALQILGRRDEARQFYLQASQLREKLAAAQPNDASRARQLASSIMNLGLLSLA